MDKSVRVFVIHFEDHHQDFLRWYVEVDTGNVIECEPFQSSIWCGNHVVNVEELGEGDFVSFISKTNGELVTIKYPVEKVDVDEILIEGGES